MNRGEQESEPLTCMRDNVAVSAENAQCLHPSSSCPFRELCLVKNAIRRKKRHMHAKDAKST